MTAACAAVIKKDSDKVCGCIADKAATEFSRYDRMMMTASFRMKPSEAISQVKGLLASGIPADKVKAAEDGAPTRIKDMLKGCNAE